MTESAERSWRQRMADADPRGVEAALREGAAAVPGLKELALGRAPGPGPWLAISTLGQLPGEAATEALFELARDGDAGVARLALPELAPRLEPARVGRVLALLERREEPALRGTLYELAARLDATLGDVRAMWEAHPPGGERESRGALLALHLLGDPDAYEPLIASLSAMDPADAAEPLEVVRARPPDAAAARLLVGLFADTRLVDRPPPPELDLGLGPGLRVCDLAALCALERFGESDAAPEPRRYDDRERADLAARIMG